MRLCSCVIIWTLSQNCIPLLIEEWSDDEPLYWTVPCMLLWKDLMTLRSLWEHPILWSSVKRPLPLTRLKALVRSKKSMNNGCLCSLHYSWSYQSETIMSTLICWLWARTKIQRKYSPQVTAISSEPLMHFSQQC